MGIALRLLSELSSPFQPDTRPIASSSDASTASLVSPFATPNGATLVLASRNVAKAEGARKLLYKSVGKLMGDDEVGVTVGSMVNGDGELSSSEDEDEKVSRRLLPKRELSPPEYRRRWLQNLVIDLVELDLASISSTFACADGVKKRYPYVTHLLLNAGGGPFVSLNWPLAVYSILTNFLPSVTSVALALHPPRQPAEGSADTRRIWLRGQAGRRLTTWAGPGRRTSSRITSSPAPSSLPSPRTPNPHHRHARESSGRRRSRRSPTSVTTTTSRRPSPILEPRTGART